MYERGNNPIFEMKKTKEFQRASVNTVTREYTAEKTTTMINAARSESF